MSRPDPAPSLSQRRDLVRAVHHGGGRRFISLRCGSLVLPRERQGGRRYASIAGRKNTIFPPRWIATAHLLFESGVIVDSRTPVRGLATVIERGYHMIESSVWTRLKSGEATKMRCHARRRQQWSRRSAPQRSSLVCGLYLNVCVAPCDAVRVLIPKRTGEAYSFRRRTSPSARFLDARG